MEDYIPQAAWVVHTNFSGDYYIEKHKVVNNSKGESILGAGAPLNIADVKSLIDAYSTISATTVNGLLPKNCIHWSQAGSVTTMAWIRPTAPAMLLFSSSTQIPSGIAKLPPLLFVARNKKLSVYALDTNEPEEGSQVYYPPFMNIMAEQSVCLGSAAYSGESYSTPKKIQQTMESLFFKSEFSYIHSGGKVAEGVNMNLLWKELINEKKEFPLKALAPLNKSVIEIL